MNIIPLRRDQILGFFIIALLVNGFIVYGQPTPQNEVEQNGIEHKEKESAVYTYPRYREETHAEELTKEIKNRLGYKLMAEYEGDKVDGSITVGDQVMIVIPKLSEQEKAGLDEIVKNHYSKSVAQRMKAHNVQYECPEDLVAYIDPGIREEIDAVNLADEIKSKLEYKIMADNESGQVNGFVNVNSSEILNEMTKLNAQEKAASDQFMQNSYQKGAKLKLDSSHESSSPNNYVFYTYPRYRQEMHAGDLALEIKAKLGYKLIAEYDGDNVDGSITVGDEVTLVMFKPLSPDEKSVLDQIVAQHHSEKAAAAVRLHTNGIMAIEMTHSKLILQVREPYARIVQRERLPGVVEDIEIELIRHSRRPLRINIGRIEDLMLSIREKGLLQPIIVRPCANEFEVVAGNRRLEACRKLEWKKVPCLVVEIDDREAFEISLIENIQRNSMNPIEEALAFKRYVEDYGWGGISDLARRIGKSASYVSRRIKLLDLPYSVQEEIMKHAANVSTLQEVIALQDEFTRGELAELIVRDNLERNDVRGIVRRMRNVREDEELISRSYENLAGSYDTAIKKSIAVLKISLIRLDEIINSINTSSKYSWMFRELLLENRRSVHKQIDFLYKLSKKIGKFRM